MSRQTYDYLISNLKQKLLDLNFFLQTIEDVERRLNEKQGIISDGRVIDELGGTQGVGRLAVDILDIFLKFCQNPLLQ